MSHKLNGGNIHSKTICFFGASAAMPVQSFLAKFRSEFLDRVSAPSAVSIIPLAAAAT